MVPGLSVCLVWMARELRGFVFSFSWLRVNGNAVISSVWGGACGLSSSWVSFPSGKEDFGTFAPTLEALGVISRA